ncbi:5-methylcytosine restriction system specificity protein McrC [Microbacterium lacticum]
MLKAAIDALLPDVGEGDTRAIMQRLSHAFGHQPMPHRAPPSLPQRHRPWSQAYALSQFVLEGRGLKLGAGEFTGPGFVISTWAAWQSLCEEVVRRATPGDRTSFQQSFQLGWRADGTQVDASPDIAVLRLGKTKYLLDAKYKTRRGKKPAISSTDIYEGLAFLRAGKAKRITLLYPALQGVDELPLGGWRQFDEVTVDDVRVRGLRCRYVGLLAETRSRRSPVGSEWPSSAPNSRVRDLQILLLRGPQRSAPEPRVVGDLPILPTSDARRQPLRADESLPRHVLWQEASDSVRRLFGFANDPPTVTNLTRHNTSCITAACKYSLASDEGIAEVTAQHSARVIVRRWLRDLAGRTRRTTASRRTQFPVILRNSATHGAHSTQHAPLPSHTISLPFRRETWALERRKSPGFRCSPGILVLWKQWSVAGTGDLGLRGWFPRGIKALGGMPTLWVTPTTR